MTFVRWAGMLAGFAVLAGCIDDEVILQGKRLSLRAPFLSAADTPDTTNATPDPQAGPVTPFKMPAQVNNADWAQASGGPAHRIDHPALAPAPALAWSAAIGKGNNRRHRISSDPVILDGRVFTMDSLSQVTATSTAGKTLWTRDLTPSTDRPGDASGGGVAAVGSKVFATTGFGEVFALDAASGDVIWQQALDAPATSGPTVMGDLVYLVSRDNRAWAIGANDGRVRWQLPGTPSESGMVGGAGPAVTDRVAIFPFGSGELVAALRQGGVRLWAAAVSGQRSGRAYANVTDIVADPVVIGDVIYTGNQSGRSVALDLASGKRIWTADDGAYGPVWVAGGSVFLISDQAVLVRLDAATGKRIWGLPMPYFKRERARRSKAVFAHFGPVLAGGNLWVASDDGKLKAFDPVDGTERQTIALPGGAASNMAVAGGTMYVISGRGQLLAFR